MDEAQDVQTETVIEHSPMRRIVDTYEQTQRMRIQLGNRWHATDQDRDYVVEGDGYLPTASVRLRDRLHESERELVQEMESLLARARRVPRCAGARVVTT